MVPRETVSFVFPRVLMFPETKSKETSGLEGETKLTNHIETPCGQQLRNCILIHQEHVTKNQPVTELILSSESLAI